MKKNEIYDIEITDMGNDGEGIGHVRESDCEKASCRGGKHETPGFTVFVKDAVIGDTARVKIVKAKKNFAYGRLVEVLAASPHRVEPACQNAKRCGGCTLMHMSYEEQLSYKWNKVRECLERIGGVIDAGSKMESIYGMEEPYYYRNKMQFPVDTDREGNVRIGFYAGRTHSIIDLEHCVIGHPVNTYVIRHVRRVLNAWQKKTGSFIYDETCHSGLVRHILTRVGFSTGELMVCMVINGDSLPEQAEKDLISCVQTAVGEYNREAADGEAVCNPLEDGVVLCRKDRHFRKICLASVSVNINKEKTNRILGDKCKTLWGQDYITDYIGDIAFHISPLSFYQVNPAQTRCLYDKALEYAALTGKEIVWDMYCGIGTISLSLARHAAKVYGVEIVPQAIDDAKENARLNGIDNAEFFCGRAEEVVPGFYCGAYESGERDESPKGREGGKHPDVVVVDPPRKGCDGVLLDTIGEMAPARLVYVSCDPATLARDVKVLTEKGYEVERIAVFDQFGHSGHVETVALMSWAKD